MIQRLRTFLTVTVVIAPGLVTGVRLPADELPAANLAFLRTPLSIDSGVVVGSDISQEVHVPGAAWIRLNLAGTVLGSDGSTSGNAYLRMTSLLDGGVQTMQASHLHEWGHWSAYFNGDTVRIELIAAGGPAESRLVMTEAIYQIADDPVDLPSPRTYCDNIDNRELTDSGRVARVVSSTGTLGTVFVADDPNHTFLTSGQVAAALTSSTVIEFHAPQTYPNGTTINHPSPSNQYVADLSSIQRFSGASGSGDNWGYFGALPNSTTGMTPFQAEGQFFMRATALPPADGRSVRTYGNGFTQPPIFRTWSYVQKTEVAPYVGSTGTLVKFRADLTAGDSGAAILDESTGQVIAMASDDGCTATGGFNGGTGITNPKLRVAMNFPRGVCVALVYSYPNGIPPLLNPNGGPGVRVVVSGANGAQPQPGSGLLHYNAGAGWITVAMNEISPNQYDAIFPAFPCGTFVDYYFSATTTTGYRIPDQINSPVNTFRSAAATSVNILVNLNFETAVGWDVENVNLTDGAWERGVPVATGVLGAPTADYDGSGQCWLTGNRAGDSDVDGGPTRLRSPVYDLTGRSNVFVSYARWFTNTPPDTDRLSVQISTNSGATYTTYESIADTVGWQVSRFKVSDLAPLTSGMRFRFSVADPGNNSRTEAALDAFSIIDYACDTTCTKGDVDNNGAINGRDVGPFVAELIVSHPGSQAYCAADIDGDGVLEIGDDLSAFVNCLLNGTCP